MDYNKFFNKANNYIRLGIFLIIILAFINGIVQYCESKIEPATPPVESNKIDSLIIENDKLIIKVETLDSIKDAKIIEVKSLDNDSTIKLFYQLIGK